MALRAGEQLTHRLRHIGHRCVGAGGCPAPPALYFHALDRTGESVRAVRRHALRQSRAAGITGAAFPLVEVLSRPACRLESCYHLLDDYAPSWERQRRQAIPHIETPMRTTEHPRSLFSRTGAAAGDP